MSAHIGFLIAGCVSFVLTLPVILLGWVRRYPNRHLAAAYYSAGYAVMVAGYIVDTVDNLPLFMHGFVAGLGAAQVAIALALIAPLPHRVRRFDC